MQLLDILLYSALVIRCQCLWTKTLQDFRDQVGHFFKTFQPGFDASTPGFDILLPVNPANHLLVVGAPCTEIGIVGWYLWFRDVLRRHEPWWRHHCFWRLRPSIENIHYLALITHYLRTNLLAHPSRIDARQPERNGMKNEHGHPLRAALRLDQGKNQVFSD